MATIRKCYTCGSEYEYCPKCSKGNSQPKWKAMWDTEECKEVFNVISGYNMNIMGKDDVNEVIEKYSITDFTKFNEKICNKLNEIFPKENKKKNKKKDLDIDFINVEEPVATTESTIDEILNNINIGISEE